eukprot:9503851-Pyramimonas_sp.AAC.4
MFFNCIITARAPIVFHIASPVSVPPLFRRPRYRFKEQTVRRIASIYVAYRGIYFDLDICLWCSVYEGISDRLI